MASRWLQGWLVITGLALALPPPAAAQVSTEQGASILFFPKVIADGTWDTLIQLGNRSGLNITDAQCWYLSVAQPGVQQELDFPVSLTRSQPTHWLVSTGRPVDPSDPGCNFGSFDCNGAGLDPGNIPPTPPNFHGALLCFETDSAGEPLTANHLAGVATLTKLSSGVVSKYNGIGIAGDPNTSGIGGALCLGRTTDSACANSALYNACPQTWIMTHLVEGAEEPVAGSGSSVSTSVTILPCTQNFETQAPAQVTAQFIVTNEFEEMFSAATSVTVWADLALSSISDVFERPVLGTDYAQTRMRPGGGSGGFMVVAQQFQSAGPGSADAAPMLKLHVEGALSGADIITIPVSQH
jgi:hypothetical protein